MTPLAWQILPWQIISIASSVWVWLSARRLNQAFHVEIELRNRVLRQEIQIRVLLAHLSRLQNRPR